VRKWKNTSIGVLSVFLCQAAIASSPIPDSAWEDAILYRCDHSVTLYTAEKKTLTATSDLPLALIVKNGTGFLVDIPLLRQGEDGRPSATANIVAELNEHRSWLKLTLKTCEQIWGEPAFKTRPILMTCFDVHGIGNGEKNLYHLDLRFRDSGYAIKYRIRGIGITNPKWIRHNLDNDTIETSQ